ncbi:hypothetical protein EV385_2791 [Krasilnikovia cinnamomea]|uniref:Uncharacterized protein n=1 Tax=Krasilnikovia cinnamomea TaxID=349313 RepID=A0A4V2G730_9ACTN|nr:hypothetical protein EV385_2791 [Krasilnikovia cinnamomea]
MSALVMLVLSGCLFATLFVAVAVAIGLALARKR